MAELLGTAGIGLPAEPMFVSRFEIVAEASAPSFLPSIQTDRQGATGYQRKITLPQLVGIGSRVGARFADAVHRNAGSSPT
jgi:hypothetical protein